MKKFFKGEITKHIIYMFFVYFVSQVGLLFVEGRWWDDWFFFNEPAQSLRNLSFELSRPSLYYIMNFANFLPEPGYRVLTFIMFFVCSACLYLILIYWLNLSKQSAFWICILYEVIPVNDARILKAVFPYTIGAFFFMVGFALLSYYLSKEKLNALRTVLCLIIFTLSYVLNSNIFFYGMVCFMILFYIKSWRDFVKFIPFFVLPVVFFVLKNRLFPVNGGYHDYNTVTTESLIYSLKNIAVATVHSFELIMQAFFDCGNKIVILVIGLVCILCFVLNRKLILKTLKMGLNVIGKKFEQENIEEEEKAEVSVPKMTGEFVVSIVIGAIFLAAGLFPYVVVRQTSYVMTAGIYGRDSMLLGIGMAMLIYGIVSVIVRKKYDKYVFTLLIALGSIYFGRYYLSYQNDYYRQLGFQSVLAKNAEYLADDHLLLFVNNDADLINVQAIYQLNGNAELVFGSQDRLFLAGVGDMIYLRDDYSDHIDYFIDSGNYHMSTFDRNKRDIDAIIMYSFSGNNSSALKLRLLSLINSSKFESSISDMCSVAIYQKDDELYDSVFNQIMEAGYNPNITH